MESTKEGRHAGRPPRSDVAANRRMSVMITDAEYERIHARAKARGVSLSDMVRAAVLADEEHAS